MIPDTYMLNQMDAWITGNYGDDFFDEEKDEDCERADLEYERMRDDDF